MVAARLIEAGRVRKNWLAGLVLGTFLSSWLAAAPAALAQQWNEKEPTPEERAKQFDDLAVESERLQQAGNVLRKVSHLVKPSVVHIDSVRKDRYARKEEDAGSGTILQFGEKFYVLTNRHVIRDATSDNITIKLADGREIHPVRIWADQPTDIAVVSIQGSNLVPARVGNSDDIDVGDFVLAVGSPFGLSQSVTFGIISAKGRRDLELDEGSKDILKFQDFFQTDAPINPGNSGGPLVNMKGEVIGMNTAIASSTNSSAGVGFTIPIDMAMIVAKQLIDHGTVTRAYLGVVFYNKEKDKDKFSAAEFIKIGLPRPEGARLAGVVSKSPAEAAKLQRDDIILEFNGVPIEDDSHLMFLVSLIEVGKDVPITVFRAGQPIHLSVKVGDRADYPE
ncbi:MAG TPA: trypsin-like peptidase domain-containing protein [Pirellulales bacterium]|jgi:serine protease Do|nr:trypsin-like peptidase domain-containing protein [Pirellulales bacterium]